MSDAQVIERVFNAPIDVVWKLWTSAEGIARWFGPRGFQVEVTRLELEPGGAFVYTMNATDPERVAAMERQGRPPSWAVESKVTEVDPPNKFVYESPMGPETMTTSAEFGEVAGGVKLVLVISATKDGMVGGAAMGFESSLDRFAEALGG